MADPLRERLEKFLATQIPHPVWARIEVLWDQPYDLAGVWTKAGNLIEHVTHDELLKRVQARNRQIKGEESDPLRFSCEPDIWRRIDIEMCKKRLELPGEVIELLVTGGMRPGKTEGATRRVMAHHFYTQKAHTWCLHQIEDTSKRIQQKRVWRFFAPELKSEDGKMKKGVRTNCTYRESNGFTGNMFLIYWNVKDESGREAECGGECDFLFYKQDIATLQGSEITIATSDELVPLPVVKSVAERLTTRAADTAKPEFLDRIRLALSILESGRALPLSLLAAVYHSSHIITFTPKEGWTPTVNFFLQGARKYQMEPAEMLVNKAGVLNPQVPRFAQPKDKNKLVAYLFTQDNVIKPAYPALKMLYMSKSEKEIRVALYGDVDKDWQTQFPGFSEDRHVRPWKDMPRDGTIYEICDPGGRKPWVLMWILCDVAGRHWILQEWPCESIPIEGALPGPWAIASENDNVNGDAGPAQQLKLKWARARYTHLLWQMRMRIASKFRETGEAYKGQWKPIKLQWSQFPDWTLEGECVMCHLSIMDSRFGKAPTESATTPGETVTVLEAMSEEENAIDFIPASGDSLNEGDLLINGALDDDILGLPGLIVNAECTNTIFTLLTYSLPPFREHTKATDEACKDFRDPIAYYLKAGPYYAPPSSDEGSSDDGGCGY